MSPSQASFTPPGRRICCWILVHASYLVLSPASAQLAVGSWQLAVGHFPGPVQWASDSLRLRSTEYYDYYGLCPCLAPPKSLRNPVDNPKRAIKLGRLTRAHTDLSNHLQPTLLTSLFVKVAGRRSLVQRNIAAASAGQVRKHHWPGFSQATLILVP
jgi:hypothetical protein